MHTGGRAAGIEEQAAGDARGIPGRHAAVRRRRQHLHRRRGGAVAARQAAGSSRRRRNRRARRRRFPIPAASTSCRRSSVLGAPHWDSSARGHDHRDHGGTGRARTSCGRRSKASPIRRANWWKRWKPTAVEKLEELRVDGGAAANNFLMQFQADILGKPIVRPAMWKPRRWGRRTWRGWPSGSSRVWPNSNSSGAPSGVLSRRMTPIAREELYAGWKEAVARCRYRA